MIRYSARYLCPICGGHDQMERGKGLRCAGFISDDPDWARCTRAEHAGDLKPDERTSPPTYAHKLTGECRCGTEHGARITDRSVIAHRTTTPAPPRKIVATYDYQAADGRVLYRVARMEPKGFLPQHVNGTGTWEPGYASDERVLYRLPALIANPGRAVFVVEGEKDADRLASLGLLATTNAGGSASWRKHAAEYAEAFRDRARVPVLVDNDDAGRKWAPEVAATVAAVGTPVVLLELPGLAPGGDVSDWLDAGHTVDELKARVASAQRWTSPPASPIGDIPGPEAVLPIGSRPDRYGTVCLSDVQPEAVDWLWFGRLALGKLTLIDGDPGLGKSLLSLDSTARVTTGSAWPDGLPCAVSGSVLLLGAEDGLADTVRPRLDVAHAAIHRVHALPIVGERPNGHPPSIPDDIPDIEAALTATGAVLLVIDPLMAFLGGKVNSHHDQDVRRALAPLAEMADRLRVAVLVIRHLNKSSGGPAIYRGGGSIGLAGAARIVLAVGSDPEDESRRILASVKSNLSAPPPSLAYQLVEQHGTVRIEWLGTSTVTAGQLLAAPADDEERSAMDEATSFLRDRLGDGWVEAATATKEAAQTGISARTLKRAKALVGVVSERKGFGSEGRWFWSLSDSKGAKKPIDGHPQDMAPNGESWPPMDSDVSGERVY